jgi:hypothetical protein
MMVMMIAITPSLNASSRSLLMVGHTLQPRRSTRFQTMLPTLSPRDLKAEKAGARIR